MDEIEEKRVHAHQAGKTDLLVAAAIGVLSVSVSADRVGGFGVVSRCEPVDVAADGGVVAVATSDDVLVREPGGDEFVPTGFGPAVAVGVDDGEVAAAAPDGRVARLGSAGGADRRGRSSDEWTALGELDAGVRVRAIDGRLVAASDGVHRLPGLDYVGLDDVNDVAASGPLAATGHGLYTLGNGWMDELAGDVRVAASAGDRAHAATIGTFFERRAGGADEASGVADASGAGEWREVTLPADGPVVDVAYGETTYAVTTDGVLLTEGEDGWRAHPLGVEDAVGCAVS